MFLMKRDEVAPTHEGLYDVRQIGQSTIAVHKHSICQIAECSPFVPELNGWMVRRARDSFAWLSGNFSGFQSSTMQGQGIQPTGGHHAVSTKKPQLLAESYS